MRTPSSSWLFPSWEETASHIVFTNEMRVPPIPVGNEVSGAIAATIPLVDETGATETEGQVCEHFQRAAEMLGRRWNPQVIRVLLYGPARFGELRERVPGDLGQPALRTPEAARGRGHRGQDRPRGAARADRVLADRGRGRALHGDRRDGRVGREVRPAPSRPPDAASSALARRRALEHPVARRPEPEPLVQTVGVLGVEQPAQVALRALVDAGADQLDAEAVPAVVLQSRRRRRGTRSGRRSRCARTPPAVPRGTDRPCARPRAPAPRPSRANGRSPSRPRSRGRPRSLRGPAATGRRRARSRRGARGSRPLHGGRGLPRPPGA